VGRGVTRCVGPGLCNGVVVLGIGCGGARGEWGAGRKPLCGTPVWLGRDSYRGVVGNSDLEFFGEHKGVWRSAERGGYALWDADCVGAVLV
jgi:hypothetical protein